MTEFILSGRGGGKTHRLIDWVLSGGENEYRVIVVADIPSARSIRDAIMRRFFDEMKQGKREKVNRTDADGYVSTLENIRFAVSGRPNVVLSFDDVDRVLQSFTNRPVEYITGTGLVSDGQGYRVNLHGDIVDLFYNG